MNDLNRILAALSALSRRERMLGVLRWASVFLATALLLWLGGMAAAGAGLDRGSARLLLLPGLLVSLGMVGWRLRALWGRAGSLRHQAARVAQADPSLRGLIPVLAEQPDGPSTGQSAAIHQLLVDNVAQGLRRLDVARVHPYRLWGAGVVLALAGGVFLAGARFAPMGPFETLAWLAGGNQTPTLASLEELDVKVPPVRVGDVSLRYEYPSYTGLPPLEIDNSNGEVHGPPGTRVYVSGRSEDRFDQTLVQSYDLPPQAAESPDGRAFSSSFVILEDGGWRVLFQRGAETRRSAEFPIILEPDDPPIAELNADAAVIEVDLDTPFTLRWAARDDFGLEAVELVNGTRTVQVLAQVAKGSREERGEITTTAGELGLRPGSDNALRVAALDNDEVTLPKVGTSRPIRVRVLGDAEEARREVRYRKQLRDALVQVLAPFVLDEMPLGADREALGVWARPAAARFEPLNVLVDSNWQGDDLRTLEGRIIEEVQSEGSSMLRFAMELSVQDGPLDPRDQTALAESHEGVVALLETYVLMLDRIVRAQGMSLIVDDIDGLIQSTQQARGMADYQEDAALKQALGELQTDLDAMMQLAESIDNGAILGMVGQSVGDLRQLYAAAETARKAGDLERSAELLEWSVDELERLRANIASWQGGLEAMTEGEGEELRKLIEELRRLEDAERTLLSETQGLREGGSSGDAELARAWQELERLAQSSLRRVQGVSGSGSERSEHHARSVDSGVDAAQRLSDAIQARDLRGARVAADASRRALDELSMVQRFYDVERPQTNEVERAADEAQQVREMLDALESLRFVEDPALSRKLAKLLPEQETLSKETRATQPKAAEIAGSLPMGAPGLEENLDAAVREMTRAERALDQGRPFAAEGAEEAAADRIDLAIRSLEQAAASQSQMSREMGSGSESEGDESGQGGESWNDQPITMELPEPERDVDIARYREQLMQGMEGEVPEEYEALKRRYYEELVRQ